MGIYSRDYARDSSGGSSGRGFTSGGDGSGWKWIIGITVAVFVAQLLFTRPAVPEDLPPTLRVHEQLNAILNSLPRQSYVDDWLDLNPQLVLKGQVWRLVTMAFCHNRFSLWHILVNMYVLWMFGRAIEQMYGTREFVLFYLVSAIFASAAYVLLSLLLKTPNAALGASGAVMAVNVLYAIHFPRQNIYIFGIIPIEARFLVGLFVIYDLFPVLSALGGNEIHDGVAHAAHLGGLAFGFLYYKQQWRLESWWDRLKPGRLRRSVRSLASRPKVKIYEPSVKEPAESFDAQVDAILAKIHEQGEASLTDKEREILKSASRRYKKP